MAAASVDLKTDVFSYLDGKRQGCYHQQQKCRMVAHVQIIPCDTSTAECVGVYSAVLLVCLPLLLDANAFSVCKCVMENDCEAAQLLQLWSPDQPTK